MTQEYSISMDIVMYVDTIIAMRKWQDAGDEPHFIIRFLNSRGDTTFKLKYRHSNYECFEYAQGEGDFRPIAYQYPNEGIPPLSLGYLQSLLEGKVVAGTNDPGGVHDPSLSHFIAMSSEAARYRIVTAQYVLVMCVPSHLVDFYHLHTALFKKYGKRRDFASHMRGNCNHYCSDEGGGPITAHDVRNFEKTKVDFDESQQWVIDQWFEDSIKADALLRSRGHGGLANVHGVLKTKRRDYDQSEEFQNLLDEVNFV